MKVRIALSGASSTGKSTLAREISKRLTLPLIHEGMKDVRRRFAERNKIKVEDIPLFDKMTLEEKMKWQIELVSARLEKENSYDQFIGDGSALDMLAWYKFWCGPHMDAQHFAPLAELLVQHALKTYDHVFYLPLGMIPLEDDQRRITNPWTQQHIDDLLKADFARMAIAGKKVWIMDEKTVEDRANFIMKTVVEMQEGSEVVQ